MTHSTTAIYENGVLKPTQPLEGIPEHAVVRIEIEPVKSAKKMSKEEWLAFLKEFPADEELADAIEEGRKQPWPIEEF